MYTRQTCGRTVMSCQRDAEVPFFSGSLGVVGGQQTVSKLSSRPIKMRLMPALTLMRALMSN